MLSLFITSFALANGGPFVLKYPNGDPAAKGVLARIDPDLKPGYEKNLRVLKEELKVVFADEKSLEMRVASSPIVHVSAEYTIENPTEKPIEVDFGFPILRGIYLNPHSMMPRPEVKVQLDEKQIECTIISNSAIYGIIRQRARAVIEKAISENSELKKLVEAVRSEQTENREASRKILYSHLADTMNWSERDAILMLEHASLDFGNQKSTPPDRTNWMWVDDKVLNELTYTNLGPLSAIGEQKATQFFAQLASRFDTEEAAVYEAIFTAWGGNVRERSVDLESGKIRPREITIDPEILEKSPAVRIFGGDAADPTIYARVDYLDPKANITESEKKSCKAILKNLPVIFTFAPMNILHYQVKFPAKSTQTLTVSYSQYAYSDTRSPSSYQLAYVVHPASLWKDFGPINLEVAVPAGVGFRASVPCINGGIEEMPIRKHHEKTWQCNIYTAVVKQKTGELYVAVDAAQWKKLVKKMALNELRRTEKPVTKQTIQKAG